MDAIGKMRMIPDRVPDEVVRYIYANAQNWQNGKVAWLENVDGEVVERIFFYREYKVRKHSETRYTECVRKISGDKRIIWRNGYWNSGSMATPFQPVYYPKNVIHYYCAYADIKFEEEDFGKWKEENVDLFSMCVPVLNLSLLSETKYKYCAYPQNCDLMHYLSLYDKDHSTEFFGKCGLYPYPSCAKLAKKDKAFCRFLRENAADIDLYGPQAAMYAYKHGVPVVEARRICEENARMYRQIRSYIGEVEGTKIDRRRLYEYLKTIKGKKRTDTDSAYNDYLRAIKGLGLDLRDTKNVYPNDFWRMHDLRVSEYAALEAKRDREKKKKLYEDFAAKATKLKKLEQTYGEYTIVIPSDISDLIREGEILHHCVGKMGYDLKVVKGTSIIAFLRKTENRDTPLYTVEYRTDLGKVSQCYGEHDHFPAQEIRDIADAWGEFVKKTIKENEKNGNSNGKQSAKQRDAA